MPNLSLFKFLLLITMIGALAGCSWFEKDEVRLEGERLSVLELEKNLKPDYSAEQLADISLPNAWKNAFWPQAGGYPNHSMQHLSLSEGQPTLLWKADIGEGSTKEIPLTTQPIVVYGHVFTLDTESNLSAFDVETGKRAWRIDIKSEGESDDDTVIAGGISYGAGVLYVTNGFDEAVAVHPEKGEIFWRAQISAPSRSAPTVLDGRVFVSTLDNRLQALDGSDGTLLWEYIGISESAGIVGGASAAANNDVVVPVFSSGEISALRVENGSIAWSDNLSNTRGFAGLSGLSDIKALPVLDKELVFAISFSGRIVAIDQRTGTRVWQREIGGTNTPWVAGDHLFILSDENQVIALSRTTGAIQWLVKLPNDIKDPIFYSGPVLAGNRLMVASTEGDIIALNPLTGESIRDWSVGGKIEIAPIVANDRLFILRDDGTLSAYK